MDSEVEYNNSWLCEYELKNIDQKLNCIKVIVRYIRLENSQSNNKRFAVKSNSWLNLWENEHMLAPLLFMEKITMNTL